MEDALDKEDAPKKVVEQTAPAAETPVEVDSPKTPKPKRRWLFVLQLVGGYLVAAWTLLQFLEWFLRRNDISPYWVDFFLWTLLGILPALLYYFYHKDRIDDRRWKWKDGLLFSGNLLILCLVLFFGFRSADLGATTQEITYVDVEGEEQKKTIVKEQFRNAITVFNFTPETPDSAAAWLSGGIRKLLVLDLQQDHHLYVKGVASEGTAADKISPVKVEGYVLDGTYRANAAGYVITPTVKSDQSGKVLATRTFSGPVLLDLLDSISVFVRQNAGVSEEEISATADLPLEDYTSSSPEAIRYFCQARYRVGAERAVTVDSTFALAAMHLGIGLYRTEYLKDAQYYLGMAFRHRNKLPLELRYSLLGYWYLSQDKLAAAEEVLQLQLEINPQNAVLNQTMARIYAKKRDLDKLATFSEAWLNRDLSYESGGAFASALHLRAEPERFLKAAEPIALIVPNDPLLSFNRFKAYLIAGDYDAAEKTLRTAEVNLPEYEAQFKLYRECLDYLRAGNYALADYEPAIGTYRNLTSQLTTENFSLPPHEKALAFENNGVLGLLFPLGKNRMITGSGWWLAEAIQMVRNQSGEVSSMSVDRLAGENAQPRKSTMWRVAPSVVQGDNARKVGDFATALISYRKAAEQFPDHYYLRDLIAHLEYLEATPPETVQQQLASVVGTYQERNFTLEDGRLFYKRQSLGDAASRYYPKLEMLPMSATHYVTPDRLHTRMAFDYRSDGQVASYSELYDQGKGDWYTNERADDYKLREEELESR